MKKEQQAITNEKAITGVSIYKQNKVVGIERLNTCKANVEYLEDGSVALISYGALVALLDWAGNFYDVLRYTYGYTATSAHHIAKFRNKLRPLINNEYRYPI